MAGGVGNTRGTYAPVVGLLLKQVDKSPPKPHPAGPKLGNILYGI